MAMTGAVAGGIAGLASAYGQYQANTTNKRLAKEQMDFQREMANTPFSRAVEDLKRAGLNPILAAGAQAGMPAGSMAKVEDAIGKGASSALEAAHYIKDLENLESITKMNDVQRENINAEVELRKQEYRRNRVLPTQIAGDALGDEVDKSTSEIKQSLGEKSLSDRLGDFFGEIRNYFEERHSAKEAERERVRKFWNMPKK